MLEILSKLCDRHGASSSCRSSPSAGAHGEVDDSLLIMHLDRYYVKHRSQHRLDEAGLQRWPSKSSRGALIGSFVEDSTYLLGVDKVLQAGRARVHGYLHKLTEPKLLKRLDVVLMEGGQKQL